MMMDAAPGVEEWTPAVTAPLLFGRAACGENLLTAVDCGNGVCCPVKNVCVLAANGATNCRRPVQGLGTAEVPGLTVSTRE